MLAARRHALAQGPGPRRPIRGTSADLGARRDRRPGRPSRRRLAGAASRPTRPVGPSGLEREFEGQLAGPPGGTCSPATACSRTRARGAPARAHDDRPEGRARRDRGARRPLRRRRRDQAAHRRGAGARRASRSRHPAARLDLQDRHARPARWRTASAKRTDRSRSRTRRRSPASQLAERQRRVLRRHASSTPSRTRATRSSRRSAPSSAPSGSSRPPSSSASTSSRRSRAPTRARSRPATEIGDDLAVGSTAIGQGKVQATALQMAIVARDDRHRRPPPAPDAAAGTVPRVTRVTSRSGRAHDPRADDATVVRYGTGAAAAAGRERRGQDRHRRAGRHRPGLPTSDPHDTRTDAWFTAFAPAAQPARRRRRAARRAGAGGDSRRRRRAGAADGAATGQVSGTPALPGRGPCSDVEHDRALLLRHGRALMCSSSGRLLSDASLTLNRIIAPCWTTPLPAALDSDGISWPAAIEPCR